MLSNPELEKNYGTKVTWLFVSRNHKGDAKDREAERTHDRFGVSCWPVLIAFDPRDDSVYGQMPRGLAQCSAELDRILARGVAAQRDAKAPAAVTVDAPLRQLADPDPRVRAVALEEASLQKLPLGDADQQRVAAMLADEKEDVVVRIRALRLLTAQAPERARPHLAAMLGLANDVARYAVLDHLAAHPDPATARTLEALFRDVARKLPSINPNVVRIRAAQALATCGDAQTVDALAPTAREANPRNGLTGTVLKTLAALAQRLPVTRSAVVAVLLESLPAPVADGASTADARPALGLVRSVRDALAAATGRKDLPAVPAEWTEAARARYRKELEAATR